MPRFAYSARDSAGAGTSATLEAPSRKDALRMLAGRGLQVTRIEETATAAAAAGKAAPAKLKAPSPRTAPSGGAKAPSRRERLPFLEAIYDLTSSGLSAGEAVRLLSIRIKEPKLKALCTGLWERLSEGAPLSRAMSDFPQVFDTGTINLVHAGEATGSLNDTVARLISHLVEQRELRRQLLTSLAYPVFMVVVAGGVILFFLFFLLPRLQSLLASLGGALPLSTQILVDASNFALHYGIFIVLAAAFAAVAIWRSYATEKGRASIDAWLLKLPLVGPFLISRTVMAISQTLNVLLENGITAVEALRMTEKQITNSVHRKAFKEATSRVMEGEALSQALSRTGCFPDLVLDRLSVGENTGNVVPSLKAIAAEYRKIISRHLNTFTTVIASTVLGFVFIFVGFIALAIISAVFSVSSGFK